MLKTVAPETDNNGKERLVEEELKGNEIEEKEVTERRQLFISSLQEANKQSQNASSNGAKGEERRMAQINTPLHIPPLDQDTRRFTNGEIMI